MNLDCLLKWFTTVYIDNTHDFLNRCANLPHFATCPFLATLGICCSVLIRKSVETWHKLPTESPEPKLTVDVVEEVDLTRVMHAAARVPK